MGASGQLFPHGCLLCEKQLLPSRIWRGSGDDLQISHDGNDSYINDLGTGSLKLLSNQFEVKNASDTEMMIRADQDGESNV